MTEPQKPDTPDEIDGLDYPTGRPIILSATLFKSYNRGLLRGIEVAEARIRRKFWAGWLCGWSATFFPMLLADYLLR